MGMRIDRRWWRALCSGAAAVVGLSAIAGAGGVQECCVDFSDQTTAGFAPCPTAPNIQVTTAQPGPSGAATDFYLRLRDLSGSSVACGPGICGGNWAEYAQGNCGAFCFDIRLFNDGCFAGNPLCDTQGWIPITPSFTILGGGFVARFTANNFITTDAGPAGGWHTICAPIGFTDTTGNLPTGPDGVWTMITGTNADWNTLLANVQEIRLPIDFTANPAEIAGYDNLCLRRDQCGCMEVTTTELDCIPGSQPSYNWTFCVTNTSGQTANALSIITPSGVMLSNQAFAINPPLADGDARCFTLTVTGAPAGVDSCFTFILRRTLPGQPAVECCRAEVCINPPGCCFETSNVVVTPAPTAADPNRVQVCLDITNETNAPGFNFHHLFIIDPDLFNPPTFGPQYFTTPSPLPAGGLPPGGTATICFFINNPTPGSQVCFDIEVHDINIDPCCSEMVCVDVPGGTACPCPIDCPPDAVREMEPCGMHLNDMCQLDATTPFMSFDKAHCGTTFINGPMADSDWWYFSVVGGSSYTVQFRAQFAAQVTINFIAAGGGCADGVGLFTRFVQPCTNELLTFTAPGTGVAIVVVDPVQSGVDLPCDICNEYGLRVSQAQPLCTGDLNFDGVVGLADVATLINNWATVGPIGDANRSGLVDLVDLSILIQEWGQLCD